MTTTITNDNATFTNTGTLTGAPVIIMSGANVTVANAQDARIIADTVSQPAIVITGNGGTITNAAGGIIRTGEPTSLFTAIAIIGSAGRDVVTNAGFIGGAIDLGGGNDEYRQSGGGLLDNRVFGGQGDDSFTLDPSSSGNGNGFANFDGGAGTDRLILRGVRQNYGGNLSNVEILDIQTNAFYQGSGDLQRIEVNFTAPDHFFAAIRFTDVPNADVVITETRTGMANAVSVYDRASVRSITGDDRANAVTIGNDTVISGAIALGGGDDTLTVSLSQFSNPERASFGSLIDGGTGNDRLSVQLTGGRRFDASNVRGFEVIDLANGGQGNLPAPPASPLMVVSNLGGAADVTARGQRFTGDTSPISMLIENAALGAALLRVGPGLSLTIDAASVIGTITNSLNITPPVGTAPNDLESLSITSAARIIGDVRLNVGDDRFDGRSGTTGGTVFGFAGNDTLLAGDGNTGLDGGDGRDTLIGGAGNNVIDGGAGNDVIAGGGGDDRLIGGAGLNELIGGIGNDVYVVSNRDDSTIEVAGEGVDEVQTTLFVYGLQSNVENLTLTDAANHGAAVGNALDNVITGNAGIDDLFGREGNDTLRGGTGAANSLFGQEGDDLYIVEAAGDSVFEFAGQGLDTVHTALATFVLRDHVENLTYTGPLANAFTGIGSADNNVIAGSNAADFLSGLDGNDVLIGGTGDDFLLGGAGRDQFRYTISETGIDRLTDFVSGVDQFAFVAAAFGATASIAFRQAAGPIAADTAQSTFLLDTTSGFLFFDPDGSGTRAAFHFATLNPGQTLSVGDFLFI